MFWQQARDEIKTASEFSCYVSQQTMKNKHILDKNSTRCIKRNKYVETCGFWNSRRQFQAFSYTDLSRARRHRLASSAQRKAANMREQRRMMNLKDAFKTLRECLPVLSYKKKMTRIETLRLAIVYIKFLQELVNSQIKGAAINSK